MLRRIFRIYPLSLVVVMAVYALEIPGYVFPDGHVYFLDTDPLGFATHLLLVQNVVVTSGGGVLLGVLWTLPIELQMYLLLPFLFSLLSHIKDSRILLLGWFSSMLMALGLPAAIFRVFGPALLTFDWGWIVFPRVVEFAPAFLAGVLAYRFWRDTGPTLPFAMLPALLLGFTALYAGAIISPVPGRAVALTWMLCCLAIGLLLPRIAEPSNRWLKSVSATIAKYSYGIYLVHVPCIWLGFDVLSCEHTVVQWVVFLLSTWLIAALLYHAIERPFIALGTRLAQRWSAPSSAVVAAV